MSAGTPLRAEIDMAPGASRLVPSIVDLQRRVSATPPPAVFSANSAMVRNLMLDCFQGFAVNGELA